MKQLAIFFFLLTRSLSANQPLINVEKTINGAITRIFSSDGEIDYRYKYKKGYISHAYDAVNDIHVKRVRDSENRLKKDQVSDPFTTHITRKGDLTFCINNIVSVRYTDDTIERYDSNGGLLYQYKKTSTSLK